MSNKTLLSTLLTLITLLLVPQGAWADGTKLETRTTKNDQLASVMCNGYDKDYPRYIVSGATFSHSGIKSKGEHNSFIISKNTTNYFSLTLSGDATLQEGDIISIEGYMDQNYSEANGYNICNDTPATEDVGKVLVAMASDYTSGTWTTRTYTVTAGDVLEGKNIIYIAGCSDANMYVHKVAIKRTGCDDLMPNVLEGDKTWNFTTIRGGQSGSINTVDGTIVNDDLFYGKKATNGTDLAFVAKMSSTIYPIQFQNAFGTSTWYRNPNITNLDGSALMFIVPEGRGVITISWIGKSGKSSDIFYRVGIKSAETITVDNDKASTLWTTSFAYDVAGETPIWIYSTSNVTNSMINSIDVKMSAPTITINSTAQYATYCYPLALDFSETGATVYKAKGNDATKKVTLTPVTGGKVPANTGVILYKASGGDITPTVIASADALENNELKGITADETVVWNPETDTYNYILEWDSENSKIVFNRAIDGGAILAANKAYLQTSVVSEARMALEFSDDETTGISEMERMRNGENETFFDLQGRRVAQPTKGLYIMNGKKVVIK